MIIGQTAEINPCRDWPGILVSVSRFRYYFYEYAKIRGCMIRRVATVASRASRRAPSTCRCRSHPGCPLFHIVGRITVNLAPADLPKEGSHYDLPIALGLMGAIGAIPHDALSGFTVLGELALDGSIAPVAGVLPAAIGANGARLRRDTGFPTLS